MIKAIRRSAVALAVTLGVSGALTGAAFADTTASSSTTTPAKSSGHSGGAVLAAIQTRATAAIDMRLSSLHSAVSDVGANQAITSSDKTTLLGTLNGDLSGLTALAPTIQGDTTASQALADYKTIFTTYRVYALALPQVRLAAATDDLTDTVLPRLTDAQTKLAGLLAGTDSGQNSSTVQAEMTDLGKQIQSITSATNGLSASILALTPAQYDANPAILSQPKQAIVGARADATAARQDVSEILAALK